jgi:hypothetical protein
MGRDRSHVVCPGPRGCRDVGWFMYEGDGEATRSGYRLKTGVDQRGHHRCP